MHVVQQLDAGPAVGGADSEELFGERMVLSGCVHQQRRKDVAVHGGQWGTDGFLSRRATSSGVGFWTDWITKVW
jgi:hypothetical protein